MWGRHPSFWSKLSAVPRGNRIGTSELVGLHTNVPLQEAFTAVTACAFGNGFPSVCKFSCSLKTCHF